MTRKVHDFQQYLEKSHHCQDLPFWGDVYKAFFGDGIVIIKHSASGEHQKAGIDRSVVLPDSSIYRIEEKVDYHHNQNMFIEYWSDWENKVPGWINKPLRCDYIVYAILALGEAYFFKPLPLQRAWVNNRERWIETYHEKRISNQLRNHEWTTVGVPVPVNEVYRQYKLCHRIHFSPVTND